MGADAVIYSALHRNSRQHPDAFHLHSLQLRGIELKQVT